MDIALYHQERGAGAPLVLLHGNGEDGGYFIHQIEYFSKSYRVLAVDTRGHGRSPRGTAPFTLGQFAADLGAFLTGLGLERVLLLGFSDGANIALRFALDHPEQVRALVLNGGNLSPAGVRRRTQWPIELGYRIARRFAGRSEEARRHAELLGLMVLEPQLRPSDLAGLRVPTLVIAGTRDMIREAHTRQIAAAIPGAALKILPGNHFVAHKNPEAFNRAVAEFLNTV